MVNKLVTIPKRPVWRRPPKDQRPVNKITYNFGRYAESEFLNALAGKKVIIVGPAAYMLGKKKGEFINTFDYIVRVNHAIPIEHPADYGSRTDILYHILSRRNLASATKKLIGREEILLWKRSNLKWLVSRHDVISRRIREMGPKLKGSFPWVCIRAKFYMSVRQSVKRSPNTGIVAIAHLLTSQLKELHIMGFDFYRTGVYPGYGNFRPGEEAGSINKNWHETESQVDYLRKLVTRDVRLKPDKTLSDILAGEPIPEPEEGEPVCEI